MRNRSEPGIEILDRRFQVDELEGTIKPSSPGMSIPGWSTPGLSIDPLCGSASALAKSNGVAPAAIAARDICFRKLRRDLIELSRAEYTLPPALIMKANDEHRRPGKGEWPKPGRRRF
jgi:hypothetical protein